MRGAAAFDIVALGESLIDFAPADVQPTGKLAYVGSPGGAPANVLACAAKLGKSAAFIGKVGNDAFGALLRREMEAASICTRGLVTDAARPTTLAFVSLDAHGDRSFAFYRSNTADCMLTAGEVDAETVKNARIFHIGSLSLTQEPAAEATRFALRMAKEAGALISYDPNLRPLLWESLDSARAAILSVMGDADIVKVSDEELEFLTGEADEQSAMEQILKKYDISLLCVTKGACGSVVYNGAKFFREAAKPVQVVDTTGAGDAFCGAFLAALIETGKPPRALDDAEIERMHAFASACGSLATTKRGAIPAMPARAEIMELIRR